MIDRKIAKFKLRRGTDSERKNVTFEQGELIYTTDTRNIFVGDGVTVGGISIGTSVTNGQTTSPDNITITTTNNNAFTLKTKGISAVHFSTNNTVLTSTALSVFSTGIGLNYDNTDFTVINGVLKANPKGIASVYGNGGIVNTADGLSANVDGITLKIASNKIYVNSISASQIYDTSINRTKLDYAGSDACYSTLSGLEGSKDYGLYIKPDTKQLGFDPTGKLILATRMLSGYNNAAAPALTGWQRMPGNFMMQWGKALNAVKNNVYTISLPQSFSVCCNVQLTLQKNATTTDVQRNYAFTATPTLSTMSQTNFSFYIDSSAPTSDTTESKYDVMWCAIGQVAALT